MVYIINTLKNNGVINQIENSTEITKKIFNIEDIKEISTDNSNFQTDIKNNNDIDGIVLVTDDVIKNISLIVFLMDINKNMLIIIPNKKNYLKNRKYQNILGVPIVNVSNNLLAELNLKNSKNTIPHVNDSIEKSIDLIKPELSNNDDFKRYIAMQIIYDNPYYKSYLNNIKIKLIKEDLDYTLNNKTIDTIDSAIKLIK